MKIDWVAPGLVAFYDGRVPGVRLRGPQRNWVDDGAYSLGCCAYAVVEGSQALVYDTHMTLDHARIMRAWLDRRGVHDLRVVLSHGHLDHVAGNEVFEDCEIWARRLTADLLTRNQQAIETAPLPIRPLVLPNRIIDADTVLTVGSRRVELRALDIHSEDGLVLWLPDQGLLLAGDTLEDSVTYVSEPWRLAEHLKDLERLATWPVTRIFPNHGSWRRIAGGGYPPALIEATRLYVTRLTRLRDHPDAAAQDLRTFAADAFATGAIDWFEPYEAVHRDNVKSVMI